MTDNIFTVVVLFTMIWVALGVMTAVHWRAAVYALLRCALRHVLRRPPRRAVAELVVFPTDVVVVVMMTIEDPCPICCARPLSVKLAPCAHALCAPCAARVAVCPFCRTVLEAQRV